MASAAGGEHEPYSERAPGLQRGLAEPRQRLLLRYAERTYLSGTRARTLTLAMRLASPGSDGTSAALASCVWHTRCTSIAYALSMRRGDG